MKFSSSIILLSSISYHLLLLDSARSSVAPRTEVHIPTRNCNSEIERVDHIPPTACWSNYPLFVKPNPEACGGTLEVKGLESGESCPIGTPFEFESDHFKGKLLFRVRDLESSNQNEGNKIYFSEKSHYNQFIIQGRFKKPIHASDIAYGGEFKRPLKRAPPAWFEKVISVAFSTINAGVNFRLSQKTPSALVSLPGSAKVLRADTPGTEPDITQMDLEENNSAFAKFAQGSNDGETFPMSAEKRRKIFSNKKKSKDIVFDTETVYTFEHYDDIMDYRNYIMDVGIHKFDMSKVVNEEPFQIMAKNTVDGHHLWSFQLWHEKLLPQI